MSTNDADMGAVATIVGEVASIIKTHVHIARHVIASIHVAVDVDVGIGECGVSIIVFVADIDVGVL